MIDPNPALLRDLKYGIIYVYGNPKQIAHFQWFATMIEPMMRPLKLEWRETYDVDYTLIVSRRFNVGNLGKYATCQLRLTRTSQTFSLLAAVHTFSDCLEDIADPSEGDVVINDSDYNDRNALPQGRWGRSPAFTNTGSLFQRGYDLYEEMFVGHNQMDKPAAPQDHTRVEAPPTLDYRAACRQLEECQELERQEQQMMQDEQREEIAIEDERQRDFDGIKAQILRYITTYNDDPQALMNQLLEGKVILNDDGSPGRLLVNGDMKVVLPDYDEMEVKMTAMCRTVYILFLKLKATGKQGMRLADMDHYREELKNIYSLVKPTASDDRMQSSVDNLCNQLSNALNETISKINRYIKNVIIDKRLAQQYIIDGTRGELYGVALKPDMISLPNAVLLDA